MVVTAIKRAATHWVTAVLGVLAALSTVWSPAGALFATLWANLGTLLPILATMQARVAPQVGWLSASALEAALFVTGVLYVAKLADRLIDKYQERV